MKGFQTIYCLPLSLDLSSSGNEFLAQSSRCSGPGIVGHVTALPSAAIHSPGQHGAIPGSSKNGANGHPSSSTSNYQCVYSHRTAAWRPPAVLPRSFTSGWSWTADTAKVSLSEDIACIPVLINIKPIYKIS